MDSRQARPALPSRMLSSTSQASTTVSVTPLTTRSSSTTRLSELATHHAHFDVRGDSLRLVLSPQASREDSFMASSELKGGRGRQSKRLDGTGAGAASLQFVNEDGSAHAEHSGKAAHHNGQHKHHRRAHSEAYHPVLPEADFSESLIAMRNPIKSQSHRMVETVAAGNLDSMIKSGVGDYAFVFHPPGTSVPGDPSIPTPPTSPKPANSPPKPSPSKKEAPKSPPVPGSSPKPIELNGAKRVSLGRGKFSEVVLAKKGGKEYALKHTPLYPHHPLIATRLLRESSILAQLLPHPNLVRVYETIRTPGHFYLVEENLGSFVTLEAFVAKQQGGTVTTEVAWIILDQMSSVVRSLHEPLRVCHRDIKPENVLIGGGQDGEPYVIKLLDLGLATHFSGSEPKLTTCCGSPAYHSPELWQGLRKPPGTVKYWGPEVDIWCTALSVLRCVSGTRYPLGTSHSTLQSMTDKVTDALLRVPDPTLRRTLAGLMHMDGNERIEAFEALVKERDLEWTMEAEASEKQRDFKKTNFLPVDSEFSLDLPLVEDRKLAQMIIAECTGTRSRSASRARPADDNSSATSTPHLGAYGDAGGGYFSSPHPSPLLSHQQLPNIHSPLVTPQPLGPPDSPRTVRSPLVPSGLPRALSRPPSPTPHSNGHHHHQSNGHHNHHNGHAPTPEIVLLNPHDETIKRAVSYIKYALRCHGIIYHAREVVPEAALGAHHEREFERSFTVYLECAMEATPSMSPQASAASEALIAALRPKMLRAQTEVGRSSSQPPASTKSAPKKPADIKGFVFYMSIKKARRPRKRRGGLRDGGVPIIISLSDERAYEPVKDCLREKKLPEDVEEKRSKSRSRSITRPAAVEEQEERGRRSNPASPRLATATKTGLFDFIGRWGSTSGSSSSASLTGVEADANAAAAAPTAGAEKAAKRPVVSRAATEAHSNAINDAMGNAFM